ncbi:hypothetical protein EMIHUDRAFT_420714 [Emiliania huxleyi CCMP1516]|uniref:AMOP domain-containing protein n=2 Tax=Emiliania huxleyi TaxID=2903 RepID=A0A0D3KZS8_EMIH1|nr:hypothetical protein EMIHUDRAFT_420714 [Emiliania huxleyi CCMP1516]EOD41263.1 hypothetical protein EMIHUDRAFT_420714 [Emiliania huxleyi CCMP1516]|eukprot:XP_005793692.1 hypothetical protein EMIHUDRAFT_420714 [Emiliania huxleyi CCMP1516]
MVYICLLHAGKFSTPVQPYASVTLEGEWGTSSCIVRGRDVRHCPRDKAQGRHKCWERECLDETDFCAAEWRTNWTEATKKSFWGYDLNATEVQPRWHKEEMAHTCCHFPPALNLLKASRDADGWDAARARVDLWDEDWLNSNDYLGGAWVPIEHTTAREALDLNIEEHKEDHSLSGRNLSLRVLVSWPRPGGFAVSREWNTEPRRWISSGMSATTADPPWEEHGASFDHDVTSVLGAQDSFAFTDQLCACDWTDEHSCPGQPAGSGQPPFATDDGSECFRFCCPPTAASRSLPVAAPPPCGCGWTSDWACPAKGAPGAKGLAHDDGSACYQFCCEEGGASSATFWALAGEQEAARPSSAAAAAMPLGALPPAALAALAALAVRARRQRRGALV